MKGTHFTKLAPELGKHAEAFEQALSTWEQRVAQLRSGLDSWEAVADSIEADPDLTELDRDAARAACLAAALRDRGEAMPR